MTQRLFGAHSSIETLAFRDVPQRLCNVLLQLSERYGSKVSGGGSRIELLLTHQELASMIASTRETTTMLLNRLKREGVLASEGRWLIVRDAERLRALASAG
jgi:CRP/FNR family transcriptional regulator